MVNYDFLFECSVNGTLQENVVLQGMWKFAHLCDRVLSFPSYHQLPSYSGVDEPANGGFFMLEPGEDNLRLANSIIQRREERAKSSEYPYFDPVLGWGEEPIIDPWHSYNDQGTKYDFLVSCKDS